MNNNLTEIVFILDRSGSMSGLESDTVGGFNSMLRKQKAEAGKAYVSTVLFDHESEVLHDRVPIEKVEPMTEKQYFTRGTTALVDALGSAIRHIANVHKYAREEDRPAKTIFIITTDGYENASRIYTAQEVRDMVAHEREKHGWEFLFLGANIDAVETAARYGIGRDFAADYCCDEKGTAVNYEAICSAITDLRCDRPLTASWKADVEKDHKKRGKK